MAQVNAGRARFVSRGEYNNSSQYYLFDLVDYNGSSYFAKGNTQGNLPTNTTYWQLVAEKGNTGGDGPVGPTGNGIASIIKTASAGLIDTYTITYTNGTTSTFNITNGQDGDVTQEYVDEENERLKSVFNVLPKVAGSGESVTLNGTGDTMLYKIDLKGNTSQEVVQGEVGLEEEDTSIYVDDVNEDKENYITLKGNTYQESTTGKNMLGLVDGTYGGEVSVVVVNGEITLNGTATANRFIQIPLETSLNFTNGEKYTISVNNPVGDGNVRFRIDSDGTLDTALSTIDRINTITYNNEPIYTNGITIRITSGTTLSNFKMKPQIEAGNSATTYEPYTNGASPNPDYPQDAEVVTGNNTINICGKNLLNYENKTTNWQGASINTSDNLITYTPNSNGGGRMSHSSTTQYMRIPNGTKITFSQEYVSGNVWSSGALTNALRLVRENGTYKDVNFGDITPNTYTTKKAITYTTTEDYVGFYTYAMMYTFSGGITPLVYQVQLEYGEVTTYEPYQSQSYPVNLGSIELCKIGTYQDRIYKNNGNWYLHKEIGKVVLNGSEDWGYDSTYKYFRSPSYVYENLPIANTQYRLSNYFKNISGWATFRDITDLNGMYIDVTGYKLCFRYITYTTPSDFKTWLSTHNTTVYYVLATATETQITDTTLISQLNALYNATIYSTTHINTETSNLLPYIDLKYNVVTPAPSPDRASEVKVVKGNNTITISNEDGTKTQTYNLTLGNLELCKIGNYQDYFYKENGNWYKYGAIGKTTDVVGSTSITINDMINNGGMYSLYGGTLSGKTITYDSALLRQNTIYYPLSTPTPTEITNSTLIAQLNELKKAMSYYDKTLITQTNANKPFILDVVGIRDLQDIFNI